MLTKVAWQSRMSTDADGYLVLSTSLQAIVKTEAAGFVTVANPVTDDGSAEVISVIAAPEVEQ